MRRMGEVSKLGKLGKQGDWGDWEKSRKPVSQGCTEEAKGREQEDGHAHARGPGQMGRAGGEGGRGEAERDSERAGAREIDREIDKEIHMDGKTPWDNSAAYARGRIAYREPPSGPGASSFSMASPLARTPGTHSTGSKFSKRGARSHRPVGAVGLSDLTCTKFSSFSGGPSRSTG
jgi:hypothetical protein